MKSNKHRLRKNARAFNSAAVKQSGRIMSPQRRENPFLLSLQASAGNQAVQNMLQAKTGDAQEGIVKPDIQRNYLDNIAQRNSRTGLPINLRSGLESLSGIDLSGIDVHHNSPRPDQLNALAYTQGQNIHLGPGQEKHLPHEAWHVVQQMQGRVRPTVQAKGASIDNDENLEREADVMGAKALQAGSRSKALQVRDGLRQHKINSPAIQMVPQPSTYGTFIDATYKLLARGVEMKLEFDPKDPVDAKKIGLTQSIKRTTSGNTMPIHPTQAGRTVPDAEPGGGYYIDRLASRNNPIYGGRSLTATEDLNDTPTTNATRTRSGTYHLGKHFMNGAAQEHEKAWIKDSPTSAGSGIANSGQEFETAALAIDGAQKGMYYGSVRWGWQTDGKAKLSKIPFKLVSTAVPSQNFMAAASLWNDKTALGTIKANASPTDVFNSTTMVKKFDIATGTVITVGAGHIESNVMYRKVTIPSKAGDNTGSIRVSDMKDQGDGASTIDLPLVDVYKVSSAAGVGMDTGTHSILLPHDTRVEIIDWTHLYSPAAGLPTDPRLDMVEVRVVDGPLTGETGWANYRAFSDENTHR